jgi:hypothetical protein
MKTKRGHEGTIPEVLDFVIVDGEWSASGCGHFITGNMPLVPIGLAAG